MPRTLSHQQARRFYDRLGAGQDSQAFYEAAALELLIAHAEFAVAGSVVEFGAGTGRLAARLLADELPPAARYLALDLSAEMVRLATARLAPFGARARARQTDGAVQFPLPDQSVDRVLSTYVLDLLGPGDIEAFVAESRRVLLPGGLLAVATLTEAYTPGARLIQLVWNGLFRLQPALVGGCRPVDLSPHLSSAHWSPVFAGRVTRFGMPSQVIVVRSAA